MHRPAHADWIIVSTLLPQRKAVTAQTSGARMRVAVGLVGVAAFFFVNAAAAEDNEVCVRGSGEAAIDACTHAIASGRYDKRNVAMLYSNRGNQWDRMGQFEKAIADHSVAIQTDPTYAAGYMHRGNAYARHGDYDRAIADQTEALRIDPRDTDVFYNRGYTYSHKGDHERAIADYSAGIVLDPSNARLWGQRCWSRAVLGKQLQEAIDDCTKASSLAPMIPQILGYRGLIYLKLGQFARALDDYEAALTLTKNPNNAEWLYGRGLAKVKSGDSSGGNADIAKAKIIKADIAEDYAKYGLR